MSQFQKDAAVFPNRHRPLQPQELCNFRSQPLRHESHRRIFRRGLSQLSGAVQGFAHATCFSHYCLHVYAEQLLRTFGHTSYDALQILETADIDLGGFHYGIVLLRKLLNEVSTKCRLWTRP